MKTEGVLLICSVFGLGHEMCSLAIPRLKVNQSALKVFAELVLQEDLVELLELAQLEHRLKLRCSRSWAALEV